MIHAARANASKCQLGILRIMRSEIRRSLFAAVMLSGFAAVSAAQVQLEPREIERFQAARQAQAAGQLDRAAEQYRLVLSKNPQFAGAYLNLGIVYQLQNKYPEAIRTFRAVLAINPAMLGAKVLLGISYYMLQEFDAALAPLDQVLASDPRERQAGVYRALALLGLDRPEDAARQLRRTAEYFPEDVELVYHLGIAYSEGVRRSANLLLSASRDSALYHWAMAFSSEQKNDSVAAILEYTKALTMDPNIPQIYTRLAVLFENDNCPELARDAQSRLALPNPGAGSPGACPEPKPYLQAWKELGPVHPDPVLPRIADSAVNRMLLEQSAADRTGVLKVAVERFQEGDYQGAIQRIQSLPSAHVHWALAYLLARCYIATGRYEAAEQLIETTLGPQLGVSSVAMLKLEVQSVLALRCYDVVLSKQPDSNRARLLRARALAAANKTDQAIDEYREILRSEPDLPQVHLGIGQIYADRLDWPGAIEELKQELALSGENGLALALLGHAYAETDQANSALPVLLKVLAEHPRDSRALADLGKVYAHNGETLKAIAAYEKAVQNDGSQYRLHYRLFHLYRAAGRPELARRHLSIYQAEDAKRTATEPVVAVK